MAIINKGDRKYLIIIHLGYDGKKRKTRSKRVNLTHLTPKQAEKEIILIEKEFEEKVKGTYNNAEDMKFSEFVKIYKDGYLSTLRPATIGSYEGQLERHILPEFGYMKIDQIKPVHLIAFYKKLANPYKDKNGELKAYSTRTIKYQHQILSSIFGQAVKWQVIKENPCQFVTPPKQPPKQKKKNYFEDNEAILFLEAIRGEKLKYICAAELALVGGLRKEEILGLDINDIADWGVTIRRTSKYVDKVGMVIEECAKNDTSIRRVTLPAPVLDNLNKLKTEQRLLQFKLQDKWGDIKISENEYRILLFTQDDGKPMMGDTFRQWLIKFINRYNDTHEEKLPMITFHGLRHTNASLMIYLGIDTKTGASRMGHAQTSTFLDIYGHMLDRADKEITSKLEDVLFQKVTTK